MPHGQRYGIAGSFGIAADAQPLTVQICGSLEYLVWIVTLVPNFPSKTKKRAARQCELPVAGTAVVTARNTQRPITDWVGLILNDADIKRPRQSETTGAVAIALKPRF